MALFFIVYIKKINLMHIKTLLIDGMEIAYGIGGLVKGLKLLVKKVL